MEDTAIVDLYWQRSDRAISETDHKYGRYCHAIAYNFVKNKEDAEECVNDTWFRAWNSMPDKRPSVLSTFLGAITRHLAISVYRGKTSQKRGGGEMPLALEMSRRMLEGKGAWRIHGGGFAGTILAFIPKAMLAEYTARMNAVFGKGAVTPLMIRADGAVELKL